MVIRLVTADEGRRLRAIRLRALADSPAAFARSHDEEAALDDGWWTRLAGEGRVFVCEDGEHWCGMAGGADGDGFAELWGMWVDPAARGQGAGEALVEAVAEWARARGARRLELQVADPAGPATRLYRRLGFEDTGRAADGGCRLRLGRDL